MANNSEYTTPMLFGTQNSSCATFILKRYATKNLRSELREVCLPESRDAANKAFNALLASGFQQI